ncbi:DUF7848 domain-containing protein [Streptomyces zagrosensis]|uniref:DUF7848 domain-containing protein n=1 Tax=Streptomyces zagrosensis TaxID=1042984 RepID=A0A7W9V146_9ACTN|nr:hypothetical protein [Streptomyces zagrosensis]
MHLYPEVRFTPQQVEPQRVLVTVLCVSGHNGSCGATTGAINDPDAAVQWMAMHTQTTGHVLFSRAYESQCRMAPPGGLPEHVTHTLPEDWRL